MAQYRKSEAQEWAWSALKGQWTTLMTPFTTGYALDEDGLRRNVRHVRRLGTRGGGCTWGMGEFWSLTHDERVRVMDIVAEEAEGKWLIGAHVTDTVAQESVSLAQHAEAAGFDLLIIAPPYINTKSEEQVIEYIRHVADRTNLAIMFYNSPQFGIVMSPLGLEQLCRIPNVVGVKEASFNQQLSIETHLLLGKDLVISTPDEWIYWKAKELGFQQQVMFANTSDWRFDTPEFNYYVQFIEKASRGELDDAMYERHLRRLNELSDTWWTRIQDKYNGTLPVAMVKYWGELMGMAGGPVRPPLINLTADEKGQLKRELEPLKPRRPVVQVQDRSRAAWLTGNNNFATGMLLMVSVQNVEE
ncbi:MAG: dihydrodipicolinate synthase family protein, partial [Chloroflexota bacterium]